ncbi:MAG: methyltransferase domain-containing protein [Betaproteobacteria bacterium]
MNPERKFSTWEAAVQWLRSQNDQASLVLAAYYDDPLVAAAERYHCSEEWKAISEELHQKGGTALDIGAGRGIASYALAKDGFMVTALEPDPSDLVGSGAIRQLVAETSLSITITEEYSENLSFPDDSFDVVFARAVLHHARNLDVACREIFRVLKPGGRFFAVREHVISRREDLPAFLNKHPLHKLYGGENAFLLNEYLSALSSAGFHVTKILSPLRSPINFFPHTEESLRMELCLRLGRVSPLIQLLERFLKYPLLFRCLLGALGVFDHRPGRLYSFVADKE